MGALERARVARRGRLGGGRARQPAVRLPVERGTRRPGGRDRHRRARRAHGLLGAAVRDARVGRGAARAGDRGRRPPPPPPLHGGRATRASPGGPRPRARTRTGRPSSRPTPATTRASPATPRSSRRSARCTAATSTATSSSPAMVARPLRQRSGLRPRRRTSTASSRAAGSTRRSRSPRSRSPPRERSATRTGSPTRSGSRAWRSPRRTCAARSRRGTRASPFVREHRVQFFEGFLARDAARLHTSDGEPEAALVLFADAIAAFQRAGNVPQLIITLASVPALFERLDRLGAGGDAPRRAVARAVELPPRPRARRPRRPRQPRSSATKRAAELTAAGRGARPRRCGRLRAPADRRSPAATRPRGRARRGPAA